MKIAVPLLTFILGALFAWLIFSNSNSERENPTQERIDALEKSLDSMKHSMQEMKEDFESRLSVIREDEWLTAPARVTTPPASVLTEAPQSSASIKDASANHSPSETPTLPGDPYQFVNNLLRESQITQAENQRKQILDIQVAAMRDRVGEIAQKVTLDPGQRFQLENLLEDQMRRRSQIRGTRPWWEFTTDQWNSLRDQYRDLDKERTERVQQLLTPDQLKKFQGWEKKRPNWFRMNSYGNPRGDEY